MIEKKEEKICSFTQKGQRLQLKKIGCLVFTTEGEYQCTEIKYQVCLNRKVIETSISEYQMRKVFATYCQNIVLQLKIY